MNLLLSGGSAVIVAIGIISRNHKIVSTGLLRYGRGILSVCQLTLFSIESYVTLLSVIKVFLDAFDISLSPKEWSRGRTMPWFALLSVWHKLLTSAKRKCAFTIMLV